MEPVRVFVGTEPKQYIPQQVLGDSIRRRVSGEVEVHFTTQDIPRKGGTGFGFVRYLVPSLCGYEGKAIYLDADMVVLTDIRELHDSLDDSHSVAIVQEAEGYFGGKPVPKDNQTSVMVMNCAKLKSWDPKTLFDNVVPNKVEPADGQIRYRDFMKMPWFDQSQIQPLDPRWNHMNIVRPDTKLIHFTFVATQPWKRPSHELTKTWEKFLQEAIAGGAVKRTDILREVLRRHIHPRYIRYAFGKSG